MGSVTHVFTTGDNDPEIFPQSYYRHYVYCDNCGSFDLEDWVEPENHAQLKRIMGFLYKLVGFSVFLVLLFVVLDFLYVLNALLFGAVLFGIILYAEIGIRKRIKNKGLQCGSCKTRFAHGSDFFLNFKKNPLRLTMDDLPRPLINLNYIKGAYIQEDNIENRQEHTK